MTQVKAQVEVKQAASADFCLNHNLDLDLPITTS
jgi:hypothetical protein